MVNNLLTKYEKKLSLEETAKRRKSMGGHNPLTTRVQL